MREREREKREVMCRGTCVPLHPQGDDVVIEEEEEEEDLFTINR